jgi:capsular polysaccharide export protein
LNHTPGKVAIVSDRLAGRGRDILAALGLQGAAFSTSPGEADIVVTTSGDPRLDEAQARAGVNGAPLVRLAPAPLSLAVLDRARRPLGYRVEGWPLPAQPAVDPAAIRRELDRLIGEAGPGELRLAEDFDPRDPAVVWLDPYDRRPVTLEAALTIAGDVLRHRARVSRRSIACGVTRWKRRAISAFLDGPNGPAEFVRDPAAAVARAADCGGRVVVWASRNTEAADRAAGARGVPLARIEDGFLRSVGLGSAFVSALSLALDETGVYYDPSGPSDLETLLREADIPLALAARGADLRARLVAKNLTKYNLGAAEPEPAPALTPAGRRGVLVPGQVEDDASILRGAGVVRTNLALLERARERNPDAFLIYRPHPDVTAGYRRGAVAPRDAARLADAVVADGSITALFAQCAAVETMTSLAGFEGLIRGLEVATHGQPFYAGWGLTDDLAPTPRRGRMRTVDELVAVALVLYPLYRDPESGLPCGPETVLDRIEAARAAADAPLGRMAARLRHAYALSRHRLLGPIARRLP